MNAIVAKIFGFIVALMSFGFFLLVGFLILSPDISSQDLPIDRAYLTVLGVAVAFIYVVIVGTLSVSIHTRELAEQQVETLQQILLELRRQNSISLGEEQIARNDPTF